MDTQSRHSIAEVCAEVISGFTKLLLIIESPPSLAGLDPTLHSIQDELGRFNCWSSNIGALQLSSSTASLEFRLEEAPQLRQQVTGILNRLNRSIQRTILIASGELPHRIEQTFVDGAESSETDSDGTSDDLSSISDESVCPPVPAITSEMAELQRAIRDTITNLFKLSMIIRRPTPRGRYSASKSVTPFDSGFDIAHVWQKFPHARHRPWLVERLGKAITRRREYFRYRREHRRRLAREQSDFKNILPADEDDLSDVRVKSRLEQSTSLNDNDEKHAPTVTLTKATTFIESPTTRHIYAEQVDDVSLTSYATSTGDNSLYALRVPNPPHSVGPNMLFEYGMPFECPYCFTIQVVASYSEWKRHVYRDLQPYTCTSEYCTSQPFQERHAWFDHELQSHRKEWRCAYCKHPAVIFPRPEDLERHLRDQHKSRYTDAQVFDILQTCEVTSDKFLASACPLCDDWNLYPPTEIGEGTTIFATVAQFRRHLGKHLEQLALFSLPKDEGGEERSNEADSNDAIVDESSAGSSKERPYEEMHGLTDSAPDDLHPDLPRPPSRDTHEGYGVQETGINHGSNAFSGQSQQTAVNKGLFQGNYNLGGNITIGTYKHSKEERLISCRQALHSGCSDPADDRARIITLKGRPMKAACDWISSNPKYQSWLNPRTRSQLLWITGKVARGKTRMAIHLSMELDKLAGTDTETTVLYYFLDKQDKRDTAMHVLRGLLIRLIKVRPDLTKYLLDEYDMQKDQLFGENGIEALWRVFLEMVRDPIAGQVFCIIDGLNYCSDSSLRRLIGRISHFYLDEPQTIVDDSMNVEPSTSQVSPYQPANAPGSSSAELPLERKPTVGLKMILVSQRNPDWMVDQLAEFPCIDISGR